MFSKEKVLSSDDSILNQEFVLMYVLLSLALRVSQYLYSVLVYTTRNLTKRYQNQSNQLG